MNYALNFEEFARIQRLDAARAFVMSRIGRRHKFKRGPFHKSRR